MHCTHRWLGRRHRAQRSLRFAVAACASIVLAAAAWAERPDPADGPSYPVSQFVVEYAESQPDLPPLSELTGFSVDLVSTAQGYVGPRPGEETVRVASFQETLRSDESVIFQQIARLPAGAYRATVTVRGPAGVGHIRGVP